MAPSQATLDQAKVEAFFGKVVQDVGGHAPCRTRPHRRQARPVPGNGGAGPLTPADLAKRTGTHERYVREWLSAQAAGGYVTYDPATGRFTLPPEHAFLLLDADVPGAFQLGVGSVRDEPRITEGSEPARASAGTSTTPGCTRDASAFSVRLRHESGQPVDSRARRREGAPRSGRAGGRRGLRARRVHHHHGAGVSAVVLRRLRLSSASVEWARRAADKAGVGDRTTFEVAAAKGYPGTGYDLVTFFDLPA
jgi:hypothetical protein